MLFLINGMQLTFSFHPPLLKKKKQETKNSALNACVTAGDDYLAKWRKINQSTFHLFVMICLILVHRGEEMEGWDGRRGELRMCREISRRDGNRASQRDGWEGTVSLDQLHSKSVYSAQFGIKHNRLLSACFCSWSPIKMEFIAALRVSPNYTFSPLCSISHLH